MIITIFFNIIGFLLAIYGIYLTINGYYGSWGIVIFMSGLFMVRRFKNENKK